MMKCSNRKAPNPKSQIPNKSQIPITKTNFDLEERTFKFAKRIMLFVKKLPKNIPNIECAKQLVRSAGSVGANYLEANEALSKKDFKLRIKIARKEAKECAWWLRLILTINKKEFEEEGKALFREAIELKKIFSSILTKSK